MLAALTSCVSQLITGILMVTVYEIYRMSLTKHALVSHGGYVKENGLLYLK
jgi:hypothetical protein